MAILSSKGDVLQWSGYGGVWHLLSRLAPSLLFFCLKKSDDQEASNFDVEESELLHLHRNISRLGNSFIFFPSPPPSLPLSILISFLSSHQSNSTSNSRNSSNRCNTWLWNWCSRWWSYRRRRGGRAYGGIIEGSTLTLRRRKTGYERGMFGWECWGKGIVGDQMLGDCRCKKERNK